MTVSHRFNLSRLGVWGDEREFKVEAERTIAYAEATNDPISVHLDGTFAPPVFAVVPVFEIIGEATMSVVPDRLMARLLHGEHDFRLFRPIEPNEVLTVRAKPLGVSGKRSGVVVTIFAETRGSRGDLVNEQYFTGFLRGGVFNGTLGVESPRHGFDESLRDTEPKFTVVQRFDEDQTFRYSGPAGDRMPIHLDEDFAKSVGLPGIIIHGLCTIAFVSHALITNVSADDPARLKRLAVRLSKPARPAETITTRVWPTGRGRYAFETAGEEPGKVVISDGFAMFSQ
ncbi:MaoC/PaaZ C-terminal domain-containing protein [Mycobacterium shimoidei]|uniref:Dehydratase n=1 Tax=Mycobacterium shimoidei TaxID=29313 RepID=A0A1E3TBJ3_MYCSH|nr:MaoC/PaaZ C-terminal domain-containing protein [Mycobacterium shimoidei]MCV7260428.1 MaoC family dehydratase N-terminal domain-containing protein [Mycobacterium shimoidei]ODR11293.1 dehydratase [Mycobacterium shimoidei]ORW78157.1 dehydratase [Mycobacterium shimoidei]SRX92268.1 hypothetical protein [Nocardia brasiliensis ATCC 700358] [Mycobacterium shimoidei]